MKIIYHCARFPDIIFLFSSLKTVWLIWLYHSSHKSTPEAFSPYRTLQHKSWIIFFSIFQTEKNIEMALPGLKVERIINSLVNGLLTIMYWTYRLVHTVYVSVSYFKEDPNSFWQLFGFQKLIEPKFYSSSESTSYWIDSYFIGNN